MDVAALEVPWTVFQSPLVEFVFQAALPPLAPSARVPSRAGDKKAPLKSRAGRDDGRLFIGSISLGDH